jgi:hypothetical protein
MIRTVWNKLKQINNLVNRHSDMLYRTDVMLRRLNALVYMDAEQYRRALFSDRKYRDGNRLERYGFKVYSQCDEDGIIQEIFNRIGLRSSTFVEFGVGNGLENNTLKLLLEGWSGLWIEANDSYLAQIKDKFRDVITAGKLRVKAAFITRENINSLIGEYFQDEIDLLSIDIDGNDIHILEAIDIVTPRVIIIEYNGKFPPPLSIAQRYNPQHRWSGSDYSGSSLAAITKIANRKGYSLVGCNIVGANAFFVRNDLLDNRFETPFTADNHYQPTRYFLLSTYPSGHSPDWGLYDQV